MNKKGQAAMEFLMTYGWAILAAIIAIGVLAYFGIFNLSAPSQATVSAPLYANAWDIDATADDVILEIRNNGGETLNITNSAITVTDPSAGTCTDSTDYLVATGDLQTLTISCAIGLNPDDSFRGDIVITYRRPGSGVDLTSTGQITGTAT